MYLEHGRTCCWCSFQHEFKNKIFPNGLYMWYDIHVENILNIKRSSRNLAVIGITEKKSNFLRQFCRCHHKTQGAEDNFYSLQTWSWTVLFPALSTQIVLFSSKIRRVFVLKFYYEKRARNFLKHLVYIGKTWTR